MLFASFCKSSTIKYFALPFLSKLILQAHFRTPTSNAPFEKQNTLFSSKTFKRAFSLEGCSLPSALNLGKGGVKFDNCALFTGLFVLFDFSRIISAFKYQVLINISINFKQFLLLSLL